MLVNIGTHTIGTFTHTLRFKRLIKPKVAFSIYILYWLTSYIAVFKMRSLYMDQPLLLSLTMLGIAINFMRSNRFMFAYQVFVCLACMLKRPDMISYGLAGTYSSVCVAVPHFVWLRMMCL